MANYIYTKLVEGDDDIAGHIAYSLYKRQKMEYIQKWEREKGGQITLDALEDFHINSGTKATIESYQDKAYNILESYTRCMLEEKTNDIERDIKKRYDQKFDKILPIKKFWWGVLQSAVGAFIFAILTYIIVLISAYCGTDAIGALLNTKENARQKQEQIANPRQNNTNQSVNKEK